MTDTTPTDTTPTDTTPPEQSTAERVAAAALSVPGVTGLHGGEFGTVATYLAGRRVTGVRVDDDSCAVHVTIRYPGDLLGIADAVRAAVTPIVGTSVDVTIEDVTAPVPESRELLPDERRSRE